MGKLNFDNNKKCGYNGNNVPYVSEKILQLLYIHFLKNKNVYCVDKKANTKLLKFALPLIKPALP